MFSTLHYDDRNFNLPTLDISPTATFPSSELFAEFQSSYFGGPDGFSLRPLLDVAPPSSACEDLAPLSSLVFSAPPLTLPPMFTYKKHEPSTEDNHRDLAYSSTPPAAPRTPERDTSPLQLSEEGPALTVFRNEFVPITVQASGGLEAYEGWRIFVDENIGYAGNAKRFKAKPDPDEAALVLDAIVIGGDQEPLAQCQNCQEYYHRLSYFKKSPACAGRILLVKSNDMIYLSSDAFKLRMRFMCCCSHHQMSFFGVRMQLRDTGGKVVFESQFSVMVKPWRRSTNKRPSDDSSLLLVTENLLAPHRHSPDN